jgi:hypothetical protein
MYRLALIIFSSFALLTSPAAAKDARAPMWIVSQLSGDARVVHSGLQPVALKVNAELAPGDRLVTGATGRATLIRGSDYIVVAPRSELRLPSAPQPSGYTRVIQNLGTMLFKVRHTGIPHFTVDTPMLAAVVKGTTFTVVVDQDRSAVQVTEGTVEVTALEGGMKRLVEGGRTVFINHINPKALIDADVRSPEPAASPTTAVNISGSGDASVAAIANLTGGLVRAEVVPQPLPILATATLSVVSPATGSPATAPPATTAPNAPVPGVATPTVTVPDVTTPTVTVPGVTTTIVTVPTVTVPTVTVPGVTTTIVTVPTVTVPAITTPTITTPTVTVPTVTVPTVTVPTATVPTVTVPTITVPSVTIPTVPLPALPGI